MSYSFSTNWNSTSCFLTAQRQLNSNSLCFWYKIFNVIFNTVQISMEKLSNSFVGQPEIYVLYMIPLQSKSWELRSFVKCSSGRPPAPRWADCWDTANTLWHQADRDLWGNSFCQSVTGAAAACQDPGGRGDRGVTDTSCWKLLRRDASLTCLLHCFIYTSKLKDENIDWKCLVIGVCEHL